MKSYRTVPDTNVVISSEKSTNPNSPTVEYFRRLRGHQFEMLYSDDTLLEYILKLKELGIPDDRIQTLIELVLLLGVHVPIQTYHLSIYPPDEKDICFLLCAVNGNADYLISYDRDFLDIADAIERLTGVQVCAMLDFLKVLRREEHRSS